MTSKNSLNKQLILTFTTVITVFILVFGLMQFFQVTSLIDQNQKKQKLATQYLTTNVYDFIDKHKKAVETIANFMSRESSLVSAEGDRLLSVTKNNNPGFLNLYIANKQGTTQLFYPRFNKNGESNIGINFSDREYFKEVTQKEETIVSSVFMGRGGTTEPIIAIASPIIQSGEFVGYVLGAINLSELSNQLLNQNYGQQTTPMVLDQNNTIVFHPDEKLRLNLTKLSSRDIDFLNNNQEDGYYFSDLSRTKEYITYEEIRELNWKVLLSIPAKEITNQYIETLLKTGLFIFIAVVAISILSYYFVSNFGHHLRQLLHYVRDTVLENGVANSEFYEDLIRGPTEFAIVAEKFQDLAINVQNNRKKLVELNEDLEKRIIDRTERLQKSNNELLAINKFIDSLTSEEEVRGYIQNFLKEIEPIIPYTLHFVFNNFSVTAKEITNSVNIQEYLVKHTNEMNRHIEPIYLDEIHNGFLIVDVSVDTYFSEGDLRFIKTLVKSFSIVIRNKIWFDQYRLKHAEMNAVLESMSEGVILIDNHHSIVYCNSFIQHLLDVETDSLIRSPEESFFNLIEKYSKDAEDDYQEFINGMTNTIKIQWKHKSGKVNTYYIARFNVVLEEENFGQGYVVRDITKEEEIDFLKSNLISIASHEFKTPITTIKGSIETLLRTDADWDEAFEKELLEGMHEDIHRIQELVNDWLDISKIESGSMSIFKETVSAERIIETAILQVPESKLPNVNINFEKLQEAETLIFVDKSRIIQVIVNLITNGIRYNDQSIKEIELSYHMETDYIYIQVQDNGIGIAPKYQEKIFDRFYRVDSSATRRTGGTGLGLSISKGIIKAHSGELYVNSELGNGSTFIIKLPMRP